MTKSESNPSSRYFGELAPFIRRLMDADTDQERKEIYEKYEPQIDNESIEFNAELTDVAIFIVQEVKKMVGS